MTTRELFYRHLGQTSPFPLALEISKAEGIYLYDSGGNRLTDLISGIAVSSVGHCHPKVVEAITHQAQTYMHTMVYGEYVQSPQVMLAKRLASLLPESLNNVYLVNSGAEAIDGAMKLAKRLTHRTEIISFKNAYHGSTQGALSIMGSEKFKQAFRPLLPDTKLIEFNNEEDLSKITHRTACVVIEPIQGEAGVIKPENDFLLRVRNRCREVGALMILDEIQTGCGRTGTMWAFEQYNFVPDILCLAKALGGGLPIGAFIASQSLMSALTFEPILGHITTFGGNPVCCAAALAVLDIIVEGNLHTEAKKKGERFIKQLSSHKFEKIRGSGLMFAVPMGSNAQTLDFITKALSKGIITDWFLFADDCLRICPPLTISNQEIDEVCEILNGI